MLHAFMLIVAQEGGGSPSVLSANIGLMFWTVLLFGLLFWILSWKAFPAITKAVAAREKALEDALAEAIKGREEVQRLMDEQRKRLDAANDEGQKLIAGARTAADEVRVHLIEQAKAEQQQMLDKAKAEIARERDNAIAELRREAVDLAIAGAGKIIEKNLDDRGNRDLVDKFLTSLGSTTVKS
jgi:F-type H+-transporting ATPase subunit b